MKYQCSNCQFCCLEASPLVSYCGLSSQCNETHITNGLTVGLSVLCIILFAVALSGLYFGFRNRVLTTVQQQPVKILSQKLERKEEKVTTAVGLSKKRVKQMGEEQKKKGKLSRFHKFSAPPSTKADTERGFR